MALGLKKSHCIEIAEGVVCIPLSIVNAYLIRTSGQGARWVLVDCGLATSAAAIRRAVAEYAGETVTPAAVILTHGHFDHVGATRQLAGEWDVPVYAHVLEHPYLSGRDKYPPASPLAGRGGMAWSSPLFSRGPVDLGDRLRSLPEDGTVPHLPEWRWIATPGHSPGHVSLFRERDRVLIAGDAFVTTNQESVYASLIAKPVRLSGPPAYFTPDFVLAKKSVQTLAALRPEVAGTGHGRPMRGEELHAGLVRLALNFEEVAMPRFGRYAGGRHAVASRRGVEYVPPIQTRTKYLLAGAVAGMVVAALMWRRGRACA